MKTRQKKFTLRRTLLGSLLTIAMISVSCEKNELEVNDTIDQSASHEELIEAVPAESLQQRSRCRFVYKRYRGKIIRYRKCLSLTRELAPPNTQPGGRH